MAIYWFSFFRNQFEDIDFDDSLNLIDVDCGSKEVKSITEFITWKVIEMRENEYNFEKSFNKKERILKLCQVKNEDEQAVCHLRDDWFLMELETQDTAYVSSR